MDDGGAGGGGKLRYQDVTVVSSLGWPDKLGPQYGTKLPGPDPGAMKSSKNNEGKLFPIADAPLEQGTGTMAPGD